MKESVKKSSKRYKSVFSKGGIGTVGSNLGSNPSGTTKLLNPEYIQYSFNNREILFF